MIISMKINKHIAGQNQSTKGVEQSENVTQW